MSLQISQGSARTHYRWSEHFLHSFVSCFFRDISTNFYWNRFIFDQHRAKDKLAQFIGHSVYIFLIFSVNCIKLLSENNIITSHQNCKIWNVFWSTSGSEIYGIVCLRAVTPVAVQYRGDARSGRQIYHLSIYRSPFIILNSYQNHEP